MSDSGRRCRTRLLIEDIKERKRIGLERYRMPLTANNGRDGLRDLIEELLDACAYTKQVIVERDKGDELTAEFVDELGRLNMENEDLRDAIRLVIANHKTGNRDGGHLWSDVPQSEVDAYLETTRRLKGNQK